MAWKLTVMGQVRPPPDEFPPAGTMFMFPVCPPVRVGNFWVMPKPVVAMHKVVLEIPQVVGVARAAGFATPREYVPIREEDIPENAKRGGVVGDHVVWPAVEPVPPEGQRHVFYVLEEIGVLMTVYFRAHQPILVFGIQGKEILVDCSPAGRQLGCIAVRWDSSDHTMTLMYLACLEGELRFFGATTDPKVAPILAGIEEEPRIIICDALRPMLPPSRLLASTFTMLVLLPRNNPNGVLFHVFAPGFKLEASIRDGQLILQRNGSEVKTTLPPDREGGPPGLATPPTFVHVRPQSIALTTALENVEVPTVATYPPQSLINWARRRALAPILQYDSQQHFFSTVVEALAGVQDTIEAASMQGAFWDEKRGDRGRIDGRVPKREVEIQPIIEGFLRDVGFTKSFEVIREPTAAAGRLDFYFLAGLRGGGLVGVCMELKHAHSDAIYDGLETQLPAYMRSKGAEFGIYGVLWFKGSDFDKPNEEFPLFSAALTARCAELGLKIKVEVFDLTRPVAPTKS